MEHGTQQAVAVVDDFGDFFHTNLCGILAGHIVYDVGSAHAVLHMQMGIEGTDGVDEQLVHGDFAAVVAQHQQALGIGEGFGKACGFVDVHADLIHFANLFHLAQQRLRDNTKLYFCASKYEIENLSKPVYDYAGYDILKLTGVPRYDGLEDRSEKIILFSPTWRMNSAMPVTANEGVSRDYNPNFKDTDYYKVYNSLINNPRLLDAAREYGYRIQYVLHPIVSPQAKDFTKNRFVEIIPSIGDVSYEKLFCEASLMVTDFSGVQFDFAYMRKPVVYLHHNDIPQHYEEGTFHYTTMGFGEICHTNDELIDVLCDYMKKNCQMPEVYRKRADDFFHYSDHKNCERIYPIMLEHTKSLQR